LQDDRFAGETLTVLDFTLATRTGGNHSRSLSCSFHRYLSLYYRTVATVGLYCNSDGSKIIACSSSGNPDGVGGLFTERLSCVCSTWTALSREREQVSDVAYKPSESILMLVPSRYFVSPRMKMEERAHIKKFYKY